MNFITAAQDPLSVYFTQVKGLISTHGKKGQLPLTMTSQTKRLGTVRIRPTEDWVAPSS